jgi:4-amino-4-deoxy-L-arabinose transferase-like glycosyltransferase
MISRSILFLFLGIDAIILFYESTLLSISYREANFFFNTQSLLTAIVQGSVALFGHNDFGLRFPMMLMHLVSVILLYQVSTDYLKTEKDRIWLIAVFMLIPGVNSAALLLDNTAMVILLLLLYLILKKHTRQVHYIYLFAIMWIDVSFALLYLGLFFYGLQKGDRPLFIYSVLLFGISLYLHDYLPHGTPKGHFLDTLGLYATVFSPIVFIYLFFTLYKRIFMKETDLLVTISSTALLASLFLSFRQEIEIQVYAPYLVLALPVAAQSFFHSYRVRLRQFRKRYRILFNISLGLLVLNTLIVLLHKELYPFLEDPSDHFAHRQHVAKELAYELKARSITCVDAENDRMQLRLKFYGVEQCDSYRLDDKMTMNSNNVSIRYKNYVIYEAYVTKIPNT